MNYTILILRNGKAHKVVKLVVNRRSLHDRTCVVARSINDDNPTKLFPSFPPDRVRHVSYPCVPDDRVVDHFRRFTRKWQSHRRPGASRVRTPSRHRVHRRRDLLAACLAALVALRRWSFSFGIVVVQLDENQLNVRVVVPIRAIDVESLRVERENSTLGADDRHQNVRRANFARVCRQSLRQLADEHLLHDVAGAGTRDRFEKRVERDDQGGVAPETEFRRQAGHDYDLEARKNLCCWSIFLIFYSFFILSIRRAREFMNFILASETFSHCNSLLVQNVNSTIVAFMDVIIFNSLQCKQKLQHVHS